MSITAHHDSGKIRVIIGPVLGEPRPVWRKAPRLVPTADYPEYRHVPGRTPHPERHEDGHSYGLSVLTCGALTENNWRKHSAYLRGIDLYHAGFFWEAHEAWEGPWSLCEADGLVANLIQALILNTAAQLKVHMGNAAGARTHSQAARWRLARIRSKGFGGPQSRFLGVDVGDLIEQIKRHYGPLWDSEKNDMIRLRGRPPRLDVEEVD